MNESSGFDELSLAAQFHQTIISDDSTIESEYSAYPTSFGINMNELEEYFSLINESKEKATPHDLVTKAAMAIMMIPPNEPKWNDICYNDEAPNYTLGRCIKEGAVVCIHKAILFNLLMQKAGIPCVTLEGDVLENDRSDLTKDIPQEPYKLSGGYMIGRSEKEIGHAWNLIFLDSKAYLVDTAFLIKTGGKTSPVIQEVPYEPPNLQQKRWVKPQDRAFNITLPDGKIRHYLADGIGIKVNPPKLAH